MMRKLTFIFGVLLTSVLIQSCKKNYERLALSKDTEKYMTTLFNQNIPTNGTADEKVMDSLLLYAQQVHLWNTSMPLYDVFKPRQYAQNPAMLIEALKKYVPNSPITGKSLDKYSFLDKGTVAAELSGNNPGSFGLLPFYNEPNDVRIKEVDINSPAYKAGIIRGDRILAINGDSNLEIKNDVIPKVLIDAFDNDTNAPLKLKIRKADGSETEITLNKDKYAIDPIVYSHVYTIGATKVAYLVYSSFTFDSEELVRDEIEKFQAAGCSKIIIDLRYNGGGFVSASAGIGDLLAPSSANDQVQFVQEYNSLMQGDRATLLKNQFFRGEDGKYFSLYQPGIFAKKNNTSLFEKDGSFEPDAVYFIMTRGTASASELLINMLTPFMKVYTVGQKSFGKPVGFIGLRIGKFDVYYAMSKAANARGFSDYFDGLKPDYTVRDDVSRNWGDTNEMMLKSCLDHIQTGAFPATPRRATSADLENLDKVNALLSPDKKSHNLFFNLPKK